MKRFFKKLCFYGLLLTPLVGCLGYLYQDRVTLLLASAETHDNYQTSEHSSLR